MADVIATGHGSTLGFGTFAASIRTIGGMTIEREVVDAGDLSKTTYTRKVPGGLVEPGSFDCEFIFNPTEHTGWEGYHIPDIDGSTALCTITFPAGGNGTAANVACPAFVSSWSTPELTSDGLMVGSLTMTFCGEIDGTTPTQTLTWTDADES